MAHRGTRNADEILVATLAAGSTVRHAAAKCGVSERTVWRRLSEPAFTDRVTKMRSAMIRVASGRLANAMASAATVLRKQMKSKDETISHKAAVKITELALKTFQFAELEGRVEQLEALLHKAEHPGGMV